jgi:cell volume regulation protein A
MDDVLTFGLVMTVVAAAAMIAILSSRISDFLKVPAPALFLVAAAIASDIWPSLGALAPQMVQRVVTVALIFILFDGGMHIGWRRFRGAAGAIASTGVAGTFLMAGGMAAAAYYVFGFGWQAALLIGTALAPTDPAVVFSVLGKSQISGRSGAILEGESGANDPVGIALMASLLLVAQNHITGGKAIVVGVGELLLQMGVGAAVGVVMGYGVIQLVRRVPLPSEALYPLRTLACAALIYGVATIAHGSGFIAVFLAGIMLGDVRAPYKREVRRVHASIASLGEIVAFAVLGLTINLHEVFTTSAWWIGLGLAALLVVARPVLVGPLLIPVQLTRGEKIFVLWSGLKGAVPILLGTFVFAAGISEATLIYNVIFVVVLFSVVVQGGLVPWMARRCGVPMTTVEPEPWSLGVRFRHEPQGLRRYVVAAGSRADGTAIDALTLGEGVWISFVSRQGALLPISGETVLAAGDEVLILVDAAQDPDPSDQFARVRP